MSSSEELDDGVTDAELAGIVKRARSWMKRGDVFTYFIAGAKQLHPAAAQALIRKLG